MCPIPYCGLSRQSLALVIDGRVPLFCSVSFFFVLKLNSLFPPTTPETTAATNKQTKKKKTNSCSSLYSTIKCNHQSVAHSCNRWWKYCIQLYCKRWFAHLPNTMATQCKTIGFVAKFISGRQSCTSIRKWSTITDSASATRGQGNVCKWWWWWWWCIHWWSLICFQLQSIVYSFDTNNFLFLLAMYRFERIRIGSSVSWIGTCWRSACLFLCILGCWARKAGYIVVH